MRKFTQIQINKDIISSIILFLCVAMALFISNNDLLLQYYRKFINYPFSIGIGQYLLEKTILKLINDGLMAIFFFLLGLEMKYHITEGEFKDRKNILLPTIAAIGGFVIPALLYSIINLNNPEGAVGWAIPIATDTAFILAILSFFGNKISNSTRIFVVGLSIIDDVLAVLVLALFYTPDLNYPKLILCIFPLTFLLLLNLFKSSRKWLYYIGGIFLWLFIVQSGVHGTIAGIVLAFFIPTKIEIFDQTINLIKEIESSIHNLVAFVILPLFAFANCELPLQELSINDLFSSISVGCFVGLLVGKPLGIFGFSILAIKYRFAELPKDINKVILLAIAFLCGIGFTLSLFIGLQAFDPVELENQMKLGVLLASLFSAIIGTVIIAKLKQE